MAAEAFSPFERASYLVTSSALPQYSRWEPNSQRSPVLETTGPVANSNWSSASSNEESSDWIRKSISGGSNPIASISKSSTRSDNSFSWIASLLSSHVDRSVNLLSASMYALAWVGVRWLSETIGTLSSPSNFAASYRPWPATILLFLSTKIGALKPNASMLLAIALICARPCVRGLSGSGIRSPIATNKICRHVATSVAVGIEELSFVILQSQYWPLPSWRRGRGCAPLGPVKDDLTYVGRRGSTRAPARLFTVTACYQCFPMVD